MKSDTTEIIEFLDIKVILNDGRFISTKIDYKEANPHNYSSFHSARRKQKLSKANYHFPY